MSQSSTCRLYGIFRFSNSNSVADDLTEYLLRLGLRMTRDQQFVDFAIVHGKYELSMLCSWLCYYRDGNVATVEFKSEDDP